MQITSTQLVLASLLLGSLQASVSGVSLRKADVVPKTDSKIKDPLKHSVGEVVKDAEAPKPKGAEYNSGYLPASPASRMDLSPTDPSERIDGWQAAAANVLDDMSAEEGMRFEGSTCESVCSACSVYAAQMDRGMCFCYATCKGGECGMGAKPHIGWSNNEVTSPRTLWRANCNTGVKNCQAECLKDEFKKELKKCEEDLNNPTECFRKLSQMNKPLPHDARKQTHYCVREGMKVCDTFLNVPEDKSWSCYDEERKCTEKAHIGFNVIAPSAQTPSVWMNVAR